MTSFKKISKANSILYGSTTLTRIGIVAMYFVIISFFILQIVGTLDNDNISMFAILVSIYIFFLYSMLTIPIKKTVYKTATAMGNVKNNKIFTQFPITKKEIYTHSFIVLFMLISFQIITSIVCNIIVMMKIEQIEHINTYAINNISVAVIIVTMYSYYFLLNKMNTKIMATLWVFYILVAVVFASSNFGYIDKMNVDLSFLTGVNGIIINVATWLFLPISFLIKTNSKKFGNGLMFE